MLQICGWRSCQYISFLWEPWIHDYSIVNLAISSPITYLLLCTQVNVVRIESDDASSKYSGKDVMYIDDHGVLVPVLGDKPAVPPGSFKGNNTKPTCYINGDDKKVCCTPFVYGYTFEKWSNPHIEEPEQMWRVITPTKKTHNRGFAISGVAGECFDPTYPWVTPPSPVYAVTLKCMPRGP